VTFRDLQKLVQSQSNPEENTLVERLREKPFWIWDSKEHKQEDIKTKGDCCFNHIVGLPKKDNQEKPMFDYQKLLYDSLLIPIVTVSDIFHASNVGSFIHSQTSFLNLLLAKHYCLRCFFSVKRKAT
jgi:hypothetical protein